MSTRRALVDASNLRVVEQLAIDLHHGMRRDFYELPPEQRTRYMDRAWYLLRKLRRIQIAADKELTTT